MSGFRALQRQAPGREDPVDPPSQSVPRLIVGID